MKKIMAAALILALSGCAEIATRKIDPSWSDEAKAAVQNRNVALGMTQEQVVSSWGRPWETTKSISSGGSVEIWKYGLGQYAVKTWVVFHNGKVVRIIR